MDQKLTVTVDIVSDAVCPWCFIGKRRFEKALGQMPEGVELQVAWRPFQLNPDMPAEGMDRKAYLAAKFGGDAGADRIYTAVREAGAGEGIDFDFGAQKRSPNTVNAHRLIGLAGRAGRQDAVVEGLFRAYFLDGRDIGDVAVLTEVGVAAGLDAEVLNKYFAGSDDADRVRGEDEMARKMGVQGVPCFIFNRKYAVSGAQEPAVFLEVIEMLTREAATGAVPEPANS
ncbi:MAG: DsbA family oxidoreductase [Rhodospirillaceae bacterium]|nr:DsbA family oxidoreductase [Rhodospirillaceae bacterium]